MYCTHCGSQLDAYAQFCGRCGKRIDRTREEIQEHSADLDTESHDEFETDENNLIESIPAARGYGGAILKGASIGIILVIAFSAIMNVTNNLSQAELSESQLQTMIVNELKRDCTSVNRYVLTPTNWNLVSRSSTSVDFILYGDGGDLSLTAIPDGNGSANIIISEFDDGTTNRNLFYSGCKSLAKEPVDGYLENSNVTKSNPGRYEERCKTVWVPNPNYWLDGTTSPSGTTRFEPRQIPEQQCQLVWIPGN